MGKRIKLILSLSLAMLLLASCNKNINNENTTNANTNALPEEDVTTQAQSTSVEETETPGGTEDYTEKTTEYHEILPTKSAQNEAENIPVNSPTLPKAISDTTQGEAFTEAETSADLETLPLGDFTSFDPYNSKGLSETKIAHSYGVAKDGKPHSISVEAQKFFDKKGYNALALDTKSEGKVLYLTFDCGYENGYTAKILDTLAQKGVKAAFFCTLPEMKENTDLITRMIDEGHIVGNHSNKHPSFATVSRTRMAQELREFDDYLRTNFGYTAPVFRFPMGEYTESALDLVGSLGYKCVFWSVAYEDWDLDNQRGKEYAINTVTSRLHPGAVILLHSVSPDNAAALGDIIDWAREDGYTFKLLL